MFIASIGELNEFLYNVLYDADLEGKTLFPTGARKQTALQIVVRDHSVYPFAP